MSVFLQKMYWLPWLTSEECCRWAVKAHSTLTWYSDIITPMAGNTQESGWLRARAGGGMRRKDAYWRAGQTLPFLSSASNRSQGTHTLSGMKVRIWTNTGSSAFSLWIPDSIVWEGADRSVARWNQCCISVENAMRFQSHGTSTETVWFCLPFVGDRSFDRPWSFTILLCVQGLRDATCACLDLANDDVTCCRWSDLEWDEAKLEKIVRPGPMWPQDKEQVGRAVQCGMMAIHSLGFTCAWLCNL